MKKLNLLLASIGAGLLLIGGTVAAYVVKSADTLGARVTPGDLPEDDDGHITLKWDAKTVTNVSGLDTTTKKEVLNVTLGAESTDVDAEDLAKYQGIFSVATENLSAPEAGTPDLLNFLGLTVSKWVDNAWVEQNGAFSSTTAQMGDKFKVEVILNGSGLVGTETKDTVLVYDEIKDQIVYVSCGWGPNKNSIDEENVRTVYFTKPSGWDSVYFYAYKGTTINAIYPGKEMTKAYTAESGDVHSFEFDTSKFTTYVFNNPDDGHTSDISVTVTDADIAAIKDGSKPYYTGSKWDAKPNQKLAEYYVRGSIGGVNYWSSNVEEFALTKLGEGTEYVTGILNLTAGDEIKAYKPGKPGEDDWFGPDDNYKVTYTGQYKIYVDEKRDDGYGWVNHMYVENQVKYFVRGIVKGVDHWQDDVKDLAMTKLSGSENEYVSATLALNKDDEVKVRDFNLGVWYGPADKWLITEAGNYVVHVDSTKGDTDGYTGGIKVVKAA